MNEKHYEGDITSLCFLQELPKDQVEYVVVSYKDVLAKQSFVSAIPLHWIDNGTLWYPPSNGSEKPTQFVKKTTWRSYSVRRVYWEYKTKNRSQAGSDADKLCQQERYKE